jgi:hypothetical protein
VIQKKRQLQVLNNQDADGDTKMPARAAAAAEIVLAEDAIDSPRSNSLSLLHSSNVGAKKSARSHPNPSLADSAKHTSKSKPKSSDSLVIPQDRERVLQQDLISGADARIVPEHHAASHSRLSSANFWGRQPSQLQRLAAVTSFGDYPRAMVLPSLYLLEQQNAVLRQQLLADQMVAVRLATPTYLRQGQSRSLEAILLSQQIRGPASRSDGTSLLARSRWDLNLPALHELSHSERARILSTTSVLSPSSTAVMASNPGSFSQYGSVLSPGHFLQNRGGMRDQSYCFASAPQAEFSSRVASETLKLSPPSNQRLVYPPSALLIAASVNSTISSNDMKTLATSTAPLRERLPMPRLGGSKLRIPHFLERSIVPLATEEDQNWLSELNCFVRSDILELFRATEEDIRARNSRCGIRVGQVGLRCRYCAHLPKGGRAGRSSSFPSSLRRIYQSFTMMLRDHFGKCTGMPQHIQDRFVRLKRKTTQGATNSRFYWVGSAKRIGLVDSEEGGIWIREEDQPSTSAVGTAEASSDDDEDTVPVREIAEDAALCAQRRLSDSSGDTSSSGDSDGDNVGEVTSIRCEDELIPSSLPVTAQPRTEERVGQGTTQILFPQDQRIISPCLFKVLSHVHLVHLQDDERTGNRKSLPVGLPGLACLHCDQSGRKGLCRVFPARRRNLPSKLQDLRDHLIKCNLCPPSAKQELLKLKEMEKVPLRMASREHRAFLTELWVRMGNETGAA